MTDDLLVQRLADFRDHAPAAFLPPPLPDVAVRGRRRTRRRWLLSSAVLASAAAVVAVIVLVSSAVRPVPEPPAPIADTITSVDWTRTELTLPYEKTNRCPDGRVRVYPRDSPYLGHIGQTRRSEDDYHSPLFAILPGEVYGDLTGDGRPEAVLPIRCVTSTPDGMLPQEGSQLLVVTMLPDHSLVGLDYVGVMSAEYLGFAVDNGALRVRLRYDHATWSSFGGGSDDTAFTQVYRFDGTSFARIGGRESNLNYRGQKDANGSQVRLAAILRGRDVVCPAATVSFTFGEATAGDYHYVQGGAGSDEPGPVDLDGDGNDEYIGAIGCTGPDYDATSVYVFGQGDTAFVPISVPLANDGRYDVRDIVLDGRTLTITVVVRATNATEAHTLTWVDDHFAPTIGTYQFP